MTNRPQAGILRRLAAMFYDGLLVVAIWLIASGLPLLFTRGEAVAAGNPLMTLYLLGVTFLFFGWFWTHGGQTLGMRAWRMRLEQADAGEIHWRHALWRFLSALPAWALVVFGVIYTTVPTPPSLPAALAAVPQAAWLVLGIVWVVWDNRPGSWRDRLTGTRVVLLSRQEQAARSADPLQ